MIVRVADALNTRHRTLVFATATAVERMTMLIATRKGQDAPIQRWGATRARVPWLIVQVF
jgi:hypothetical protein